MEQAFADANNPMFKARRILEINPKHDLFARLQKVHEQGKESTAFKDYCSLLYAQVTSYRRYDARRPSYNC